MQRRHCCVSSILFSTLRSRQKPRGVSVNDPLIYARVSLVLGGAALFVRWLPVRRASRVNPMITLRAE